MIARATMLAGLAAVLVVVGLVAFVSGELMLAGLSFLGLSFVIFLRERRS